MKKLMTLITVLALGAAIGGCKKKEGDAGKVDDKAMAKPDDKAMAKPDDKMAAPAAGSAAAAAPAGSAAAVVVPAGLPQECKDYQAAIAKLATCDKLPDATKTAMKSAFDASSAAWAQLASLPAEQKSMIVDGCKVSLDGVNQQGKALCGW
jgi:hypothetical protein